MLAQVRQVQLLLRYWRVEEGEERVGGRTLLEARWARPRSERLLPRSGEAPVQVEEQEGYQRLRWEAPACRWEGVGLADAGEDEQAAQEEDRR